MDGCNCSMITSAELKALLDSDKSDAKERTLTSIETLLTSRDMGTLPWSMPHATRSTTRPLCFAIF